jgi:hypothetical protein
MRKLSGIYFLSFFHLVLLFNSAPGFSQTGNWIDNLNFNSMVQPVPKTNKFIDPGYYVWCGSVTKGDNGKFYMLYARWPLDDGFESWPITSEIAVAVSDHPGGPFKHIKVALPARGTTFWDGSATHNPAVVKHKGKYYLFYMGTSHDGPIKKHESYTDNWWRYRNTQRIGVAVADKPDGEWIRLDKPVLDVGTEPDAPDGLMVSNPAAAFDDKGKVILLYKQVNKTEKISGGQVRFGVAFADSPFGPYVKHHEPVFQADDGDNHWMVAEDPFVWFQNGTFLAIVRDVIGKFTGDEGAWALMVSKNGTGWQPAKHPKVIGSTFYWEGGIPGASKLERPCLYLENGVPKYLYGATRADKQQTLSFNVAVPLAQYSGESLDFRNLIPENPEKHIFSMPGYNIWCNGVVKGDDGKYHMFFSRWPESRGFDAWVTHSEVAHAVSDHLFGPYQFSDVALPARGNQFWDGAMTHNPHVMRHKGKYYLYYTANGGSGYWDNTADTVMPRMDHPEWWVNRNNQRVGVAVADSPYGPWNRFDKPLMDITPGRRTTGVPTVFHRPDGKFSLAYKSVMEKEGYRGGAVKHYISLSDSPLGPFTDHDRPFITSPKSDFPIDDHVEWYQDGKYYCIAKDHGDMITEHGIALLLFESSDGLDWTLSSNSLVHKFEITFNDGEYMDFDRFEMPKVYLENGKVIALFLAAKPKGKEESFSIVLPVMYK